STSTSKPPAAPGTTEFEILKASHRFLHDEHEKDESWDHKLARKYYDSLYREFAVCDLKHYKSGNFSLRWRTEAEVLSGAGESTCANTRCPLHEPPSPQSGLKMPPLTTLELPFAYEEAGVARNALVKVVLCARCYDKLMWKRRKERSEEVKEDGADEREKTRRHGKGRAEGRRHKSSVREGIEVDGAYPSESQERNHRRRRSSRSRSPDTRSRHSRPAHRR
ncbi:hypothetical protein PLICRDRAFT_80776, partial [Plicaturopsis crispa FD-325 SS-3]